MVLRLKEMEINTSFPRSGIFTFVNPFSERHEPIFPNSKMDKNLLPENVKPLVLMIFQHTWRAGRDRNFNDTKPWDETHLTDEYTETQIKKGVMYKQCTTLRHSSVPTLILSLAKIPSRQIPIANNANNSCDGKNNIHQKTGVQN